MNDRLTARTKGKRGHYRFWRNVELAVYRRIQSKDRALGLYLAIGVFQLGV